MGNAPSQVCGKIDDAIGIKFLERMCKILTLNLIIFQFYHYDKLDYKEIVINKNFRPSIDRTLSSRIQELIKEAWAPDPKKRPTFDRMALVLKAEYQELAMKADGEDTSRSKRMRNRSLRSYRARHKK